MRAGEAIVTVEKTKGKVAAVEGNSETEEITTTEVEREKRGALNKRNTQINYYRNFLGSNNGRKQAIEARVIHRPAGPKVRVLNADNVGTE